MLDWLSWPPRINPERHSDLANGLKQFQGFLARVREFYFKYLQLYNCHKHGNRIAYLTSIGADETPYAAALCFPPEKDRNVASAIRIDDFSAELKLADEILYVASVVKENWLIRRRDESTGKFTLGFPTKTEG